MKTLRTHRAGLRLSGEKMKRARRLYSRLIRRKVMESPDRYKALMDSAERMSKARLLWSCSLAKDVAYSILRVWQHDDDAATGKYGGPFGWHRWREDNDWDSDIIRRWKRNGGHSRQPEKKMEVAA